MEATITDRAGTLAQQKRDLTVDAILRAARRGMDEYGLDVTVETIAELADVGRRTVFRYFATRDDLLSEAITATAAEVFTILPRYDGGDWQAWLDELTQVLHDSVAGGGRKMWELKTRRLPPQLAVTYERLRQALREMYAATAATLWEAAGGRGAAPDRLRLSVATHLSPMFTQAVLLDADGTPELAAQLAASGITATLRELLAGPSAASGMD
ncbi:TetR/AcrR family transcriptional regulator [Nocardia sp. NPDC051570]|uniref:TetR/AcrR family transcriptional regulator n=1 Tax=Nocardia sp. NPDC051570 TaxID=3364324 RepID=UPI0037B97A0C